MKNRFLWITTFIVCLFFSLTSVHAITKIDYHQNKNGEIKNTIHFEEGFVGGLEATFKVTGDVDIEKFTLDSGINKKEYTKDIEVDNKNNMVTIRLTAGGVGTSHNLLSQEKTLTVGTLTVSTTSSQNESYEISLTKLSIIDNSWAKKDIKVDSDHLTVVNQSKFTYVVDETKPDDDSNTNDNDNSHSNTNTNANTNKNTNSNTNSSTSNTNSSSNGNSSSNEESNANPSNSNDTNSDSNSLSNSNSQTTPSTEKNKTDSKEEKEEKSKVRLWPLFLVIGVVAVIGAVVAGILYKKNQTSQKRTKKK